MLENFLVNVVKREFWFEFCNFAVMFSEYCLAFNIHKTKAVKNICIQEIFILLLSLNTGLALIEQPGPVFKKLTYEPAIQ